MCPGSFEYISERKIETWIKTCVLLQLMFKLKIDKHKVQNCTKLLLLVLSCHCCGSARAQHYVLFPVEVQEAQWDHNGIAKYARESNDVGIHL